ncbi:hypothetical protein DTW90_25835 [Neorhizobium sp. P12A]|nr:hypothetical protein DTW90_25835 [Neorhizobium sp. P12A]
MEAERGGRVAAKGSSKRGLAKPMLKLPSLRGKLQDVVARNPVLSDLLEAYDEATAMLDRLEHQICEDEALLVEYRSICTDIENDMIEQCLVLRP